MLWHHYMLVFETEHWFAACWTMALTLNSRATWWIWISNIRTKLCCKYGCWFLSPIPFFYLGLDTQFLFILIFDICAYFNMIIVLFRLLNNDRSFLSLMQYDLNVFENRISNPFVHWCCGSIRHISSNKTPNNDVLIFLCVIIVFEDLCYLCNLIW